MKQRAQQTMLGKSYKTFLKSSNSLRKSNALFYFSQFQMSIKFRANWLNVVTLSTALNSSRLLHCLDIIHLSIL